MDFCKFRSCKGPSGPYAIRLPLRAREHLAARDLTLFLQHRLNWVEDGLMVVIAVMLSGDAKVSDYLRLSYPQTFAERQRKTETDDTRRTLLFRLRYLFRCLGLVAGHFAQFDLQSFAGLKNMLDIFAECVRQAVGEEIGARLKSSIGRFSRLWQSVDFELSSEDAVRRELQILLDDLYEVFEIMREAFREKEAQRERTTSTAERTAAELAALRAAQEGATREHRRALRRCAELSVAQRAEEADDVYSSLAGLEGLNEAKRKELIACFRYSHEKFAVDRCAKEGGHTLRRLAELVWKDHAEEFAALARLTSAPGYKDARSLAAKLYKLAARYPAADHFRWRG